MDRSVDERDFALLAGDPYTFEVLGRILKGECDLILTDHASLILCHSAARHPVWIWTPDGAPQSVMDRAWDLMAQHRPFTDGWRCNMKPDLAEFFFEKARLAGVKIGAQRRLFARECFNPVPPKIKAEGVFSPGTPADTDVFAAMLPGFYAEIDDGPVPGAAECREKAKEHAEAGTLFLWKNAAGKAVACCTYRAGGALASLGSVYTLPEERRKHYAQNLVYRVTCLVRDLGLVPMLYTDADYAASNACYAAVGYVPRGSLFTVGPLD